MTPRPTTLAAVAASSASLEDFGRNLRDWLHQMRQCTSRPQVGAAIAEQPALLAPQFPDGAAADAWLGAYAELAALRARLPVPDWATDSERVAPVPWFADTTGSASLRWLALRDSPLPFKRRNLFLPSADAEFPLNLRRGRPCKPPHELRRNNAERQQRFRARRALELAMLRKLLSEVHPGQRGAAPAERH